MPSFSKNPTQTDIKRTLKYFWKKNQPSVHTICYAVTRWQALEKPKGISHNLSNNHITENWCLIFEHFCSPPTPFQKSPVIFKQQVNRLLYKTPSFSGFLKGIHNEISNTHCQVTSTEDRLIKHKDIHSFSHHENLWKKMFNISRQWIHILPLKTSKETIT